MGSTKALELLNVKLDVWIDEEEYEKVYKSLDLNQANTILLRIDETIMSSTTGDGSKTKSIRNDLQSFLKSSPSDLLIIKDYEPAERTFTNKEMRLWEPLYFAKRLRARVMQNGSDDYISLLDDILVYLYKGLSLSVLFPINQEEYVIHHLYFQELAACARSGLESLGYAMRAFDVIENVDAPSNSTFDLKLYRLWAKLNQGIGYWHSNQRIEATKVFNEVIAKFDDSAKSLENDCLALGYWRSLILDQAILISAEVQEDLQFSYHTLATLKRLNERKNERRLMKEALAYRDMRRLDDAAKVMWKLFSSTPSQTDNQNAFLLNEVFDKFEKWTLQLADKKNGLWGNVAGLVFDYSLEKIESVQSDDSQLQPQLQVLTAAFQKYKQKLIRSKPERVGYFQQLSRYLLWLADQYVCDRKRMNFLKIQHIDILYKEIRPAIQNAGNGGKDCNQSRLLSEFSRYEYDRFVSSIEKFFKKLNEKSLFDDEKAFLDKLDKFEKDKFYLYEFKRIERSLRRTRLNNLHAGQLHDTCIDYRKCFQCEHDRDAFSGVLACAKPFDYVHYRLSEYLDTGFNPLMAKDYEANMMAENNKFLDYLKTPSKHATVCLKSALPQNSSFHFMGLQRWNSQTPTLTLSQGGGYLIYEQDDKGQVILGMAIDPGFDFVDNLFHMGFTLADIDFILITHAHLDHTRDFEPIVSALLDLTKRDKKAMVKGKIHAIMSLGVYHRLENIITNPTLREFLADTYIVDIDRELGLDTYLHPFRFKVNYTSNNRANKVVSILDKTDTCDIEIVPQKAYHDDHSEQSDSFGYIINLYHNDKRLSSFGYTGDTKWHEDVAEQFNGCDILCIHLGALIESEDRSGKKDTFQFYKGEECDKLVEKKGHPYMFGLLRFIKKLKEKVYSKNRLILLSEFGEELKGGIRIDLVHRLNKLFGHNEGIFLPVDIGLNVRIADTSPAERDQEYLVWCFGCNSFVKASDIRYRHFGYGRDEGLYYFCTTCLKSKPQNVINDLMRHLCESGVILRKAES